MVTGLAGSGSTELRLLGAGEERRLSVERASQAFMTVLPGEVDPAALRLRYATSRGATRERAVDAAG